ncbi:SpoIID/LytB domain-containing protein [Draconibacterium halophilum]|uniref:SpoIID/LytB domain-containing protein n=1 Tax=Draconibacterium halophilum TaxID=2706887 RepID=A0A6C0RCW8_9BACT|nr:SpoIID/LytB domain-containing protein [Draconibacterium halophilum]QIA07886.1 SpoIID/LytB domain-containing protein [Draconibacterium halophilum]
MSIPNIHVGIMSADLVEFNFHGEYQLVGTDHVSSGDGSVRIENGKIQLDDSKISLDKLYFVPLERGKSEFELKDVTIGVNFHWEQKENQKFQGALKFIIEEDKITAVNILSIEDYLISVISSEMSAQSSIDLLKAHAIISRSWLIAQIEKQDKLTDAAETYERTFETTDEYIKWYDREDHTRFHVCADDHCQRYQGTTRSHNPNVVKAVNETAGVVLSYNGVICDARFSKCCGGIAELFENCWEPVNHPYLTAVIDNPAAPKGFDTDLTVEENAVPWLKKAPEAFCNTTDEEVLKQVLNEYDWTAKDFYRWTVEYAQDDLAALILKRSGYDFGKILDMIPIERGASGRLIKLKIVGSKKTLTVGKELEIRRWLSESHLYSAAFIVEKQDVVDGVPQQFILQGAGWGHGVGLCQIGAAVMGHNGYKYDEILHHYFKNITLEKRY